MNFNFLCPLCYDEYQCSNNDTRRPLVLNCGHTFCAECLTSWERRDRVSCPICKDSKINKDYGSRGSPPVRYLPKNIDLCNRIESSRHVAKKLEPELKKAEPELKKTVGPSSRSATGRLTHSPQFKLLLFKYCSAPQSNKKKLTTRNSPGWKAFVRANDFAFEKEEQRFRELGFTDDFEEKVMLNIRAMLKRYPAENAKVDVVETKIVAENETETEIVAKTETEIVVEAETEIEILGETETEIVAGSPMPAWTSPNRIFTVDCFPADADENDNVDEALASYMDNLSMRVDANASNFHWVCDVCNQLECQCLCYICRQFICNCHDICNGCALLRTSCECKGNRKNLKKIKR
jgi:hypothetical protein